MIKLITSKMFMFIIPNRTLSQTIWIIELREYLSIFLNRSKHILWIGLKYPILKKTLLI